jgi:hypothetical protein
MTDQHNHAPVSNEPAARRLSATEAATYAELRGIDPDLAGLFERGLGLADEIEQPGVRYLVAHIGRELSRAVISTLTGEAVIAREPDDVEKEEHFRDRIAAALELPRDHPHVQTWFESHQTLVGRAHWRKPPPSPQAVRAAFTRLAGLVFGRIAPYFDTQAELDRLLEVDNPTAADVEALRQCTLRFTQRRYFFSRLSRPGWLPALAAAGLFRNHPKRVIHDDSSWSIQSWPEGDALARLASHHPDLVVEQLLAIPADNDNPAVWDIVATAALAVGPSLAMRLVPRLYGALKTAPPHIFPRTLMEVIRMLAEAGYGSAAFQLSDALLFVRRGDKHPEKAKASEEV